jgi:hypothetical protein
MGRPVRRQGGLDQTGAKLGQIGILCGRQSGQGPWPGPTVPRRLHFDHFGKAPGTGPTSGAKITTPYPRKRDTVYH